VQVEKVERHSGKVEVRPAGAPQPRGRGRR
jgi:hypothetical protein